MAVMASSIRGGRCPGSPSSTRQRNTFVVFSERQRRRQSRRHWGGSAAGWRLEKKDTGRLTPGEVFVAGRLETKTRAVGTKVRDTKEAKLSLKKAGYGRNHHDAGALKNTHRVEERAGPHEKSAEREGKEEESKIFGLSPATFSVIVLNIGSALCGSNQITIKMTEESIPGDLLTVTRFTLATLLFFPHLIRGLKCPEMRRAAGELGLWLFLGYSMQAEGLRLTAASHGALTGTFTVLAVPLLAGFSGRKIKATTYIAAVAALVGVSLLGNDGGSINFGDGLCVASATIFGVHKWRTEALTADLDALPFMTVQIALVAVLSLGVTFVNGSLEPIIRNPSMVLDFPWLALAYMGVFTTAFVLWSEGFCLKHVSSPLAALIYSSEPVWGAFFAFCLGERFGTLGYAGAALIVCSSIFGQAQGEAEISEESQSA